MYSNATTEKCYSGQINLAWKAHMQPQIALCTLGHSPSWSLVFMQVWEEGWGTAAGRNNIIPTVSLTCSGSLQPWAGASLLAGARVEFPVHIPRGALSCPSWLLALVLGLRDCFFGVIHHGPLFSISSFPRWLLTVITRETWEPDFWSRSEQVKACRKRRSGLARQAGWVWKKEELFCLGTVAVGSQHRAGRSARHGPELSISLQGREEPRTYPNQQLKPLKEKASKRGRIISFCSFGLHLCNSELKCFLQREPRIITKCCEKIPFEWDLRKPSKVAKIVL